MHVSVNGVRLFFDVEGAKLVPDGPVMREKPTLLMLHGGPGADHSIYRPAYSALADIAQIVYLDHRGNGRSEDGPKEGWNLAQWGDDVHAFCEALGIVRSDRAGRLVRRHGRAGLCHAPPGPPFPADPDQHRSRRRLLSGAAGRAVRALRRPGSRRAGAAAFSGTTGPSGPGLDGRLGAAGHAALHARPARSGHGAPRRQPAGGAAMVHAARRREPQLQLLPGSASHPVPDTGARRRGRSDPPDREPGRHRRCATAASGAVRTLRRLPARLHAGRARARRWLRSASFIVGAK